MRAHMLHMPCYGLFLSFNTGSLVFSFVTPILKGFGVVSNG